MDKIRRESHDEFIARMRSKPGQRIGDIIRTQAKGYSAVYMRIVESNSPLGIDFEPMPLYRTKRFFRRIFGHKVKEEVFTREIGRL